ncbi:MAG: hypothetical protein KTR17_02840 [Cellvibrionaceae bacterium]|nr:hypothetical protein [Cellvibrionaceae bacterium]
MSLNPYTPGSAKLEESTVKKKGGVLSILRRIFMLLGIIFALMLLLILWAAISTSNTRKKFEGIAEPFIKEFLSNQSPWNYQLAKPHLSSAWFEATNNDQGIKLFALLNGLGKLKSIDSIKLQGCINQTMMYSGKIERCNYLVAADYNTASAQILIGLATENNRLKVLQLHVKSNAFTQ